jgi:hypothetical protein
LRKETENGFGASVAVKIPASCNVVRKSSSSLAKGDKKGIRCSGGHEKHGFLRADEEKDNARQKTDKHLPRDKKHPQEA